MEIFIILNIDVPVVLVLPHSTHNSCFDPKQPDSHLRSSHSRVLMSKFVSLLKELLREVELKWLINQVPQSSSAMQFSPPWTTVRSTSRREQKWKLGLPWLCRTTWRTWVRVDTWVLTVLQSQSSGYNFLIHSHREMVDYTLIKKEVLAFTGLWTFLEGLHLYIKPGHKLVLALLHPFDVIQLNGKNLFWLILYLKLQSQMLNDDKQLQ